MRKLETFLFFKTGYVSYHNDVSGWRIVAENIVTANGITGTKNLPSVQKDPEPKSIDQEEEDEEIFSSTEKSKPEDTSNLVYVSSCDAGIIKLFSRDFSSPEVLKPIQDIILPILSDNPSLSIPSGSSLIVAGHPEPLKVHPHAESSIDSTTRPPSPGGVVRVSTGQLGSKFYGGGGYTTQPDMEEIFLDPKGRLSNATTSAVLIEHGEGQKGDLYITGLTMEGMYQPPKYSFLVPYS